MKTQLMLCATARLARALQLDHARKQTAQGLKQWPVLHTMTVSQWLERLFEKAMLAGELEMQRVPQEVLGNVQERMLWESVIRDSLPAEVSAELFDIKGMACLAQEANQMLQEWRLPAPDAGCSEETRQFLVWRRVFISRCKQEHWVTPAQDLDWQIAMLADGVGQLPDAIAFAGFDRITPQMAQLQATLRQRNVDVWHHETGLAEPVSAVRVLLPDQEAECRAAVGWAKRQLTDSPEAHIGIVAPELATLRATLTRMLDDALHPAWVRPAMVEAPRQYDFSLGEPLQREPVVRTALALLQFFSQCRHQDRIEQQEFSQLLQQPYWSHAMTEADARAQLDARMRERLPLTVSMSRLLRFIRRETNSEKAPLPLHGLQAHITAALAILQPQAGKQQMPGIWVEMVRRVLEALEWPGKQRSLSSFEYQAIQAFDKALQALAALDVLQQPISLVQALARLRELVQEQIHQPEAEGEVRLQVMGMLESVSEPLDGLWVMGMNDHIWPPPPRPNPLLPATMQRQYGVPNADSAAQTAFAQKVHHRLLRSAQEVVFSSAARQGERELRLSPLVQDIPLSEEFIDASQSLAQMLAGQHAEMQWLDDHQAPPVEEGEHISGGTGLLKAQAICPAWAYYQYRLHARALKAPVNGLDAAERGTLVHLVLEHFWRGRGLHDLQAMDESQLEQALAKAVQTALAAYMETCDEELSEAFTGLETMRLTRLLKGWLALENMREQPFSVLASEQEQRITIEGVEIRLIIDRIDQLADGSRIVIDYKTGRKPDTRNWGESRITEPQLPVYAAFVLSAADPTDEASEVVAIAFAMVKLEEYGFAGLARDALLPGMPMLEDKKTREIFPEENFPDWPSVLAHWRTSIIAVVNELKQGEAAVKLQDEKELKYCEVLPLLRLPERKLQFEHVQQGALQ